MGRKGAIGLGDEDAGAFGRQAAVGLGILGPEDLCGALRVAQRRLAKGAGIEAEAVVLQKSPVAGGKGVFDSKVRHRPLQAGGFAPAAHPCAFGEGPQPVPGTGAQDGFLDAHLAEHAPPAIRPRTHGRGVQGLFFLSRAPECSFLQPSPGEGVVLTVEWLVLGVGFSLHRHVIYTLFPRVQAW